MPRKKPTPLQLPTSAPDLGSSLASLSDTGSLALGDYVIGRNGIKQTPPGLTRGGAVSALCQGQGTLEVERLLGRGATSRVYLARHAPSGLLVAVKNIHPPRDEEYDRAALRRRRHSMLHEIRTAFEARSDHLVSLYDAFYEEGSLNLVLGILPNPCCAGRAGACLI